MLYILTAALAVSLVAACNTVEGMGEDIRAAGNAIDKTANENNTYGK